MRTVFVNPERCIGCMQCQIACAVEHSTSRDLAAAVVEDPLPRARIHVEAGPTIGTAFPNRCRHCDPAPCVEVCPTAAMTRDAGEDLVLVDDGKCIVCAMCAMVCPFDAVTFHAVADGGVARISAVKCDGCIDRLRRGEKEPACVEACKAGALVYGEVNDLVAAGRVHSSVALTAAMPVAPNGERTAIVRSLRDFGEAIAHVAASAGDGGATR
jgi:anaerobic carbon-monoxide dehydrogenase iron sulfur subunit